MRISAVIPTLNEGGCVRALVLALGAEVHEVVVSDGGSDDNTRVQAEAAGATVVSGTAGRAVQLDRGARAASGERLWFVHADSEIPRGCGQALLEARGPWGCFETRIGSDDPRLRFTAAWMTRRAARTGVCTGDMGIWVDRAFFEAVGGFGALPTMEDLSFADRARARAPAEVLAPAIATSARRWTQEGVSRTIVRFWALRLGYRLGIPAETLARCRLGSALGASSGTA